MVGILGTCNVVQSNVFIVPPLLSGKLLHSSLENYCHVNWISGNTRGRTLLSDLDVNIRVLNHAKYSLTPQGVTNKYHHGNIINITEEILQSNCTT